MKMAILLSTRNSKDCGGRSCQATVHSAQIFSVLQLFLFPYLTIILPLKKFKAMVSQRDSAWSGCYLE